MNTQPQDYNSNSCQLQSYITKKPSLLSKKTPSSSDTLKWETSANIPFELRDQYVQWFSFYLNKFLAFSSKMNQTTDIISSTPKCSIQYLDQSPCVSVVHQNKKNKKKNSEKKWKMEVDFDTFSLEIEPEYVQTKDRSPKRKYTKKSNDAKRKRPQNEPVSQERSVKKIKISQGVQGQIQSNADIFDQMYGKYNHSQLDEHDMYHGGLVLEGVIVPTSLLDSNELEQESEGLERNEKRGLDKILGDINLEIEKLQKKNVHGIQGDSSFLNDMNITRKNDNDSNIFDILTPTSGDHCDLFDIDGTDQSDIFAGLGQDLLKTNDGLPFGCEW